MVNFVKQDMTNIWAELGDYTAPDSAKITQGWLVEAPPRQYWNWLENRQDKMLAYLSQKGIPEWDATSEYIINKSYVQHNNVVYKSIQTGTNKDPSTQTAYWKKAFSDSTPVGESIAGLIPAADRYVYFTGATTAAISTITAHGRSILASEDATAARATIDAQQADPTLTALAGVSTTTNKIIYATGSDAFATTDFTTAGRSIVGVASIAAARTVLELTKQSSLTDTTSDVLGQGAFGLGHTGGAVATGDLDDPSANRTGFYVHTTGMAGFIPPTGQTGGLVANYVRTTNALLGQATQVYTNSATVPRMWIRSAVNNTFGAWMEVWTSSNLTKQTSTSDSTAGAMMMVGAFGIGGTGISVSNANSINVNGNYVFSDTTTNTPIAGQWFAAQFMDGQVICQQLWAPSPRIWVRSRGLDGTTWSAWSEVFHEDNQLALGATSATARTALGLANSATIAASSANTASQIVQRDASGNFSANQITAAGGSFTPWIELRNNGGLPYIDFSNDGSTDFDARLWLSDDDTLTVSGGKFLVENDIRATGWVRTEGNHGWYSQTYGGGIHMTDSTWVRVYGGKKFLCEGNEIQLSGANPMIRMHSFGGPTRFVHASSAGDVGFLDTGGGWSAISKNDRWFETGAGYRFGEFARGNLYHEIDGNGNRFVRLTNWDGGGIHLIHSPGQFLAFGPNGDNSHNLGWGFARWANVFAANGTINTSDARKKTPVREMTTDELNAAKQISDEMGIYQWLESIEEKGKDAARLHSGQTVQRIMAILEENNLEPMRYAFVCYDKWDAVPTTYKENGDVDVEGRNAGDLYSLRYDQLSMFLARGLAQRQTELENRLAALEAKLK